MGKFDGNLVNSGLVDFRKDKKHSTTLRPSPISSILTSILGVPELPIIAVVDGHMSTSIKRGGNITLPSR